MNNIKQNADIVLHESGLLKYLNTIGDVFIYGSYYLDLMVHNEIDINVAVPSVVDSYQFLPNIIKILKPFQMLYFDNINHKPKFSARGIIGIGIAFNHRDQNWKIDLNFIDYVTINGSREYNNKIKSKLGETEISKIMEIKLALVGHKTYQNRLWDVHLGKISGNTIYNYVFKYPEKSSDELIEIILRECI